MVCQAPWRAARRILVVRLDNLGDVLMATPAMAAIAETSPEATLTLLTSPSGAALVPHLPMLAGAIAVEAPWVRHEVPTVSTGGQRPGAAERELVERLAGGRFDAAVVFTTCTQSALPAALVLRMAGIPLRLAHARENPYALLTDWVPESDRIADGMRHEVQRQLALVGSIGFRTVETRLRFSVRAVDRQSMAARLDIAAIRRGRYVVVHPGASAPSRRWPAERFGTAASSIAQRHGVDVVIVGSDADRPLVEAARLAMQERLPRGPTRVHTIAGDLALGELAALLEGAALVVCNNSGPAHLAAAVGTPVVDLYALTNPQHTPWQVPSRVLSHDVPCRNCLKSRCPEGHHACLEAVTPRDVVQAAAELLAHPLAAAA